MTMIVITATQWTEEHNKQEIDKEIKRVNRKKTDRWIKGWNVNTVNKEMDEYIKW